MSPVSFTQFFGNLSKVVETTLPPPISLSYLKGWNNNFEWLFYKNTKDAFNEGLPDITLPPPPVSLSYLKGWTKNFEWFYLMIYLMRAYHILLILLSLSFLRRPQILLTFIRHLTLTKSNLIKQKKFAFSFEQKSNNSILLVDIANFRVYLHYMYIFHCNDFEHLFVWLLLLIACNERFFTYFLNWCIVYFGLYPVVMLHV